MTKIHLLLHQPNWFFLRSNTLLWTACLLKEAEDEARISDFKKGYETAGSQSNRNDRCGWRLSAPIAVRMV